jgi:hypothetical protein
MIRFGTWAVLSVALSAISAGCENKPSQPLAPTGSALEPASKPAQSQSFAIDAQGSKLNFEMSAPIEKIVGEAPDSAAGELNLDLNDLTKSTGLLKIDLDKLTLYQHKRTNQMDQFGEREKSDKQNQHARAWLEIGEDAPADKREENRWAELKIDRVTNVRPQADITKMPGAERTIQAVVSGDFRLHGRVSKKRALIEATFKFDGDKPQSVTIKTTQPMSVGLDEHDVRPREGFGKLAKTTLEKLGNKVAKEAPIELEFTARAK